MASNDLATGSNGGVSILAGRNISIEDDHGGGATVVVTDGTGNIGLTTGTDGSSASRQIRPPPSSPTAAT